MKLNLDPQLNKKLRDKINEYHNFTMIKEADLKKPGNKRETMPAYYCLCACLDRIDELVLHCNDITYDTVFGVYDILNYGQTLIDCISMIANIYNAPHYRVDCSNFNQPGEGGTGNDEKYFKYLRSLCTIHPVETSRHKNYQGDSPEWCPYIISGEGSYLLCSSKNEKLKKGDYYAVVYRNDMKVSKYVSINLSEIIQYLQQRYSYINTIIQTIDQCNSEIRISLQQETIKDENEFQNYVDYLLYLDDQIIKRFGEGNDYFTIEWIAIYCSKFDDDIVMQAHLQEYKKALKNGIKGLLHNIQNVVYGDDRKDWEPLVYNTSMVSDGYAKSKILSLGRSISHLDRDKISDIHPSSQLRYKNDKLEMIFDEIDKAQRNHCSNEQIRQLLKQISEKLRVTDSEWARIQLKIIEPDFCQIIKFDYYLSDWYLYLQVILAFWLLNKK